MPKRRKKKFKAWSKVQFNEKDEFKCRGGATEKKEDNPRKTPRQRQRPRHTATTEFLSQGRDIVARRAARGRVEKDEKCSLGL